MRSRGVKRGLDVAGAALALAVIGLPMSVIALAIGTTMSSPWNLWLNLEILARIVLKVL